MNIFARLNNRFECFVPFVLASSLLTGLYGNEGLMKQKFV